MDSAALLDLLGNENRRRILRLLSRKPCYVTEISEQLGVSPKAVIDHLRKLEEAGLVESHTDDGRRKYFHIARHLRLEVTVSPYGFGAKSAYPASSSLDVTTCRHLSLAVESPEETDQPDDLIDAFRRLEELEHELSLAQRWVQGRLADVHELLADAVGEEIDERVAIDLLELLADEPRSTAEIAAQLDVPEQPVDDVLSKLADRGLVRPENGRWSLCD